MRTEAAILNHLIKVGHSDWRVHSAQRNWAEPGALAYRATNATKIHKKKTC